MLAAKFPTWYHFIDSTSHIILTVIVCLLILVILVCVFFIYKSYIKKKYINQIVENFELICHGSLLFLGRRFTKIRYLNNKSLKYVMEFDDHFSNFFENILFAEMDKFIKLLFKEHIKIKDLKDILESSSIILKENQHIHNQSRKFFYWERKQREILLEIKNLYNYFNLYAKNISNNNIINSNIVMKKNKIFKLFNTLEAEMQKGNFIKSHSLISQIWLITKRYYRGYLYLWISNEIIVNIFPVQMEELTNLFLESKMSVKKQAYWKRIKQYKNQFYKFVKDEELENAYLIIEYLFINNNYWIKHYE